MEQEKLEAERQGYSRGYYAGRRRMVADQQKLEYSQMKADFWREVFITVLAETVHVAGWKAGDVPITNVNQRVELAAHFADAAMNYCHKALS